MRRHDKESANVLTKYWSIHAYSKSTKYKVLNKFSFLYSQKGRPAENFNFKFKSKCISYIAKYNKYSIQYNPNMRVNNYLVHLLYDNM